MKKSRGTAMKRYPAPTTNDMHALAVAISRHLDDWCADARRPSEGMTWYATITHTSGASIALWYDSYRRRVECRGVYPDKRDPRDWGLCEDAPKIKFSSGRDPKHLASDIQRRLLVQYMPQYATCLTLQGQRDAAEDDRQSHIRRYAALCGGRVRDEKVSIYDSDIDVMGDAHVSTDGSVRFDSLYVPREKAEKIFAILAS